MPHRPSSPCRARATQVLGEEAFHRAVKGDRVVRAVKGVAFVLSAVSAVSAGDVPAVDDMYAEEDAFGAQPQRGQLLETCSGPVDADGAVSRTGARRG